MTTFFKNARVYKMTQWAQPSDSINADIDPLRFTEAGASEMQSIGFVPPFEGGDLAHTVGTNILLCLRVQKKVLPAAVVKQETERRAAEIEEVQGFKPGRRKRKEIKEAVTDELLPRAFKQHVDTLVWFDCENGFVVINSASQSKADEVIGMLAKAFDPFPVQMLHLEQAPASVMTQWLADDEPPAGFSFDQDTELESRSESRAKVRYVRHSIDHDDVSKHIQAGKQCTRLALTWNDRVSFVLAADFTLKSIKPLDVLREDDGTAQNAAEQFDADLALMAGELGGLLRDLIAAHGGERKAEL